MRERGTFTILLENDEILDPRIAVPILATSFDLTPTDCKRLVRLARGIIATDLPREKALRAIRDLRASGIRCLAVDQRNLPLLPPPKRITYAEWTPHLMRFASPAECSPIEIPWTEISLVFAGIIKAEEFRTIADSKFFKSLPLIYKIEDEEAKELLRKKLPELARQKAAIRKFDVASQPDSAILDDLEVLKKERVFACADFIVEERTLRFRIVSNDFLYSYLGPLMKENSIENFKTLLDITTRCASSAVLNSGARSILEGKYTEALFEDMRAFENHQKWFLSIRALNENPSLYLDAGEFEEDVTASVASDMVSESKSPVTQAGQTDVGLQTAAEPDAQFDAGVCDLVTDAHGDHPGETTIVHENPASLVIDLVFGILSVATVFMSYEIIRRVIGGQLWLSVGDFKIPPFLIVTLTSLLGISVLLVVRSAFSRRLRLTEKALLAFLMASSLTFFVWGYGVSLDEEGKLRGAVENFLNYALSEEGKESVRYATLNKFIEEMTNYKIERLDFRTNEFAERLGTVVVGATFRDGRCCPLKFSLYYDGTSWRVLTVTHSYPVYDNPGKESRIMTDVLYEVQE